MSAAEDARARHGRLQRLFLAARVLDEAERAAFLDEACAGDESLRDELARLLAHDLPGTLQDATIDSPLRRELDALHDLGAGEPDPPLPELLGEYRVLRKLGEGGMGTVYEARQEKLQRTVALKVLRPGTFSPQSLRRFEHEGAFLGRLEHPGIARIYDSGRADTAFGPQPYFAMELVEGVPLTEYAREHELSLRERLALVARVADAVQHAHRQGVIHRDLKPDNILVDAGGQPKILDFGIARAVDSDVRLTKMGTDVGQILGTLAYMSPEQALGDPTAIDARSDVYSLGVLLHELVADRLPYDVSRLSLPEALRSIQEKEPPRLGTTHTHLRGDVETIVRTALEKDKTRRYATAGSLAADLRHYLRDEPIAARPPSRIYTLRKFVRRNKTVVVATALVFLSLSAGLVAALVSAIEAAARNEEVRKLSALPTIQGLLARADSDELWPPHPDRIEALERWIGEAKDLTSRRGEFERARAALRDRSVPTTEEELERELRAHPRFDELALLEGLVQRLQVQLLQRANPEVVAVEIPDPDSLAGDDAEPLLLLAFDDLDPFSGAKGRDALGLARALRARSLATAEQRAPAELLVAWGYFFLGRDAEAELAREAMRAALDDAAPNLRGQLEGSAQVLDARMKYTRRADWSALTTDLASRRQKLALDLRTELRSWRFEDPADQWWHDQLDVLLDNLDELDLRIGEVGEAGPASSSGETQAAAWSALARREFAEQLRAGFAPGGRYAELWEASLPELRRDYPGEELGPQMGLVPIGRDPDSGLWEFAHLASGAVPERVDGRLVLRDDTGLVLVLLPAGVYWMGAQSTDPELPNYVDIPATEETFAARAIDLTEAPVRQVEISRAFFLSKYELTQGQWLRLTGTNPSRDSTAAGLAWANVDGIGDPLRHPVSMVSWDECTAVCEQFGLMLPTSAQWEYAARAGTRSAWWTGDDSRALQGAANLADQFGLARGALFWVPVVESWSDGNAIHARVGSYRANPFGLHDVHGNVSEWCQDAMWSKSLQSSRYLVDPVSRPSPVAKVHGSQIRLHRGGSFADIAKFARSAKQTTSTRGAYEEQIGLRPARPLDPPLRVR